MGLDIRIPIGMMFAILGLILVLTGLISGADNSHRSLGVNIDLWWGLVMFVFGAAMLLLGRRGDKSEPTS